MRGSRIVLRRDRLLMNLSLWRRQFESSVRQIGGQRGNRFRSSKTTLVDRTLREVHVLRLKIQIAEGLLVL
jgi:hypothetical protein